MLRTTLEEVLHSTALPGGEEGSRLRYDPSLSLEERMAEDCEIVKIVGTEEEATIVVGFLQSSGIEAQVESLHASEFPTDLGDLAQVRIRVPAGQAAEDA